LQKAEAGIATPSRISMTKLNEKTAKNKIPVNRQKVIERLVKERDEARREVCQLLVEIHNLAPQIIALAHGWNCYDWEYYHNSDLDADDVREALNRKNIR
jgi:hypothetical protein